jgi:glycosyltransferase involved in cell wall biosynthesis
MPLRIVPAGHESEATRELLSNARALLHPIPHDEPFAKVMVEALACGTPVLATNRGAVAEVVCDGVTGFVRDDVDALVGCVRRVHEIDPAVGRTDVENRFGPAAMTDRYEAVVSRFLGQWRVRRPSASRGIARTATGGLT